MNPPVSDGAFVYASAGENIYKFNLENGSEEWVKTFEQETGELVKIALGETAVFAASKNHLFALSKADGSEYWSSQYFEEEEFGHGHASIPTVTNDSVLVVRDSYDYDDTVFSFNRSNGKERWKAQPNAGIYLHRAAADGELTVFPTFGSGLTAVDSANGNQQWIEGDDARGGGIPSSALIMYSHRWMQCSRRSIEPREHSSGESTSMN
jgi:outer membrane protein assembly factor BamB